MPNVKLNRRYLLKKLSKNAMDEFEEAINKAAGEQSA